MNASTLLATPLAFLMREQSDRSVKLYLQKSEEPINTYVITNHN
jgi:hypothetical protein